MDFQKTIMQVCKERNDLWSDTVRGRIEYAQDLHAADAVYHNLCSTNFRTGREIPNEFVAEEMIPPKRPKQGRPSDSVRAEAFIKVAEYLEANDDEQTTIQDLIHKMDEFLDGTDSESYGFTYMKDQLQKHFGDNITITEINGKLNVVTFRHKVSAILHDFYSQPKKSNNTAEKMRLIETAAKLIKSDVKSVEETKEVYPDSSTMTSTDEAMSFLPESLKLLLQKLAVGKDADKKIASLGQAIMQCIRPRVLIAPLQIGLGVQMHHHFGSKFLINSLYAHGFCSSYKEVQKFERSAAVTQGTDIPNYTEGQFIQYVADNVDHNIRTIDGLKYVNRLKMSEMGLLCPITCT